MRYDLLNRTEIANQQSFEKLWNIRSFTKEMFVGIDEIFVSTFWQSSQKKIIGYNAMDFQSIEKLSNIGFHFQIVAWIVKKDFMFLHQLAFIHIGTLNDLERDKRDSENTGMFYLPCLQNTNERTKAYRYTRWCSQNKRKIKRSIPEQQAKLDVYWEKSFWETEKKG